MRLIDADELNKVTERDFCYPEAYKKLVEEQPTAYDLDKVIKELEEYAHSDICGSCRSCRISDDIENIECENCGALGALEIVKKDVPAARLRGW